MVEMMAEEKAEIDDVKIIGKTSGGAMICIIDGQKRFIPQSVIHADSEIWRVGDEGTLTLWEWFAVKEGLV